MSKPSIRIDIISDIVCPWCYLGKASLEKAMQATSDRYQFSVHWQPFQLNPDMPPEGENLVEHLTTKLGSIEKVWQAQNRVSMFGAELDLDFRFDQVKRIPNTFETHRLLFLASGQKQQNDLVGRLYEAYFRDGENVGDPAFLVQTARSLNLPEKVLHEFTQTRRAETEIRTLEQDYREAGIHAVPTYIFNQKFIVQGGQAQDVFERVFEKVGSRQ